MRKAMLLLAAFGLVELLWAADPFVGTWKLNTAKSKNPALKSQTFIIEPFDGGLRWTSENVGIDGKPAKGGWAGKYDGKDYPLTGGTDYDAIAATKLNANTFDSVLKKGGKEVGAGHGVVSENGKTLTLTAKYKNAQGKAVSEIEVYEKQ